MKKILLALFMFFLLSYSYSFAQIFQKRSSWVSKVTYQLEWCRPTTNGMIVWGSNSCPKWYLSSNTIDPNWNWFVESSSFKTVFVSPTNWTDRQHNEWWAAAQAQYFFDTYNLKAEWIYKFTIRFYDKTKDYWDAYYSWWVVRCWIVDPNTWNCFEFQVEYRIDKTHPNVPFPTLIESSPYIYVGRSQKSVSNVYEQDSNTNNSDSWAEVSWRWSVSNLQDDQHAVVTNISRSNLKTIYYSNSANWQTVKVSFNLKDYFDWDNWSYVAWLQNISVYDSNHNPTTLWWFTSKSLWGAKEISGPDSEITFTINDTSIDEKVYYLRVTDMVWNFIETPLYIVKDNTSPITSLNQFLDLIEFTQWWQKVFYTTNKYSIPGSGTNFLHSRFFAANQWEWFRFSITDTQEAQGNTNMSNSWPVWYKLEIEDENNCWSTPPENFWSSDYTENNQTQISAWPWTVSRDFTKISFKCSIDTNNTYRYYLGHIVSYDNNWWVRRDKLCDKVWNCYDVWPLTFRVTATSIDYDQSTITVWNSWTVNNVIANGQWSYLMKLVLKDRFWNKVVPVKSKEDNTAVKDVNLRFDFNNRLFADQVSKWAYNGLYSLALADSFDIDIKSSPNRNWLNSNNDTDPTNDWFTISEDPTKPSISDTWPDWIYKVNIYSYVPTSKAYPWIWNWIDLYLKNLNFKVDNTSSGITKWSGYLWELDQNKFNSSEKEFNLSTWSLAYSDTVNKYLYVTWDYWQLQNPMLDVSIASNNTKFKLNFASPFIVGYYDLKTFNEWTKNNYSVNIWKFDNSLTNTNFQFYERFINTQLLKFELWSWSTIFSWKEDTVIWKIIALDWYSNVLNSSNILNLVSSIGSFNSSFSKFVKPFLDPEVANLLSWFIDVDKLHIWVVSKLIYEINWIKVILPSDGKWVANSALSGWAFPDGSYWDSLAIFNPNYTSSWSAIVESDPSIYDWNEVNAVAQSIKVLWNIQWSWRLWSTASIIWEWWSAWHVNVWWDIKKWTVNANVQKNIATVMRGRDWHVWDVTLSSTSLTNPVIDLSTINEKFDYNWELIVPIQGNITFATNSLNRIEFDKKVTFIVKDWYIKIDENLKKTDKDILVTLVSVIDSWIPQWTDYSVWFHNWFVYLRTSVTNIDTYIFINGSLLSYNWGTKIYRWDNIEDTDKEIFNQLFIKWWIISTNTIWWSRLPDSNNEKCPWFQSPCNTNIAQAFDLIYMRKYVLVDSAQYWWPSWKNVPYLPSSIASNKSNYNANKPFMWWRRYCSIVDSTTINCNLDDSIDLDNIEDSFMEYPLYMQFDPVVQTNWSVLFKILN